MYIYHPTKIFIIRDCFHIKVKRSGRCIAHRKRHSTTEWRVASAARLQYHHHHLAIPFIHAISLSQRHTHMFSLSLSNFVHLFVHSLSLCHTLSSLMHKHNRGTNNSDGGDSLHQFILLLRKKKKNPEKQGKDNYTSQKNSKTKWPALEATLEQKTKYGCLHHPEQPHKFLPASHMAWSHPMINLPNITLI